MRLWEIGDIVDVLEGRPQISSVLRVRNMLEIVLGALVLIGVFVFWCECHGFMEQRVEENRKTLIRALLLPYSKYASMRARHPLVARLIQFINRVQLKGSF